MPEKLKICAYSNCEKSVNSLYDEEHCLFHSPKDKKGISVEVFNKLIFAQIKRKDFNFKGYIFPGEIVFPRGEEAPFIGNAKFRGAYFSGNVKFAGVQFSGYADFREAQFSGYADFRATQFSRMAVFNKAKFFRIVAFNKAKFIGDADFLFSQFSSRALFKQADFLEGVNFDSAQFYKSAEFIESQFSKPALFHKVKFLHDAEFKNTTFHDEATFNQSRFSADAVFNEVKFTKEANFTNVLFSGETTFEKLTIFSSVHFLRLNLTSSCIFKIISPKFTYFNSHNTVIEFSHVVFNPDKTFFEDFSKRSTDDNFENNVIVLFRYCMLKDVFFSHNDLGMFSFFNSTFDQARFISNNWQNEKSRWSPFYKRRNILLDEVLYNRLKNMLPIQRKKFEKDYKLEHLESYDSIAALYRRMKTSLDNTKDYFEAGWFYYNELEMKRLMLLDTIHNKSFFESIPERLQYRFYGLYKLFSGYGEKPLRSFIWFWLFAVLFFPIIHGFNGLGVKLESGKILNINYDFSKIEAIFNPPFWQDFLYSIVFSLYHIIPFNLLPLDKNIFFPSGPEGMLWSFLNTGVLLTLLLLSGLGLKRHFKRF
ncbi:MAG: pentapeptide repeat-containing protein [Calditrichaeota bacterium]|nr:MAG: pentapeptide repeat-containing protein [Calditrichota bacterium]MBL1205112.1 pentapeptide repeat-containing protein [Calditrichota bacterium]NOG44942.1 pentapeptide repeat-containing protein [Calditrichota bacterium]